MRHCTASRHRPDSLVRGTTMRLAFAAALCWALTTTSLLTPQRAIAQEAAARPCTEIQNDADRLACYDRSLRPARPAPAAASPPAAAPQAAAPQGTAPQSAPAAAATAPTAASGSLHTAREIEPRAAREAHAATPAAPAAPVAPATTGADASGIVPIVVVEVHTVLGRNDKVFTTDGGAKWVQTDNVRLSYPEPPFSAQIKPGVLGSNFLVTGEGQRAVRVRSAD